MSLKSRKMCIRSLNALALFGCGIIALAIADMRFAGAIEKGDKTEKAASPAPESAPAVTLGRDIGRLPPAVQEMRQAILAAAASGDIEQLRVPIDMNELPPVFAKEKPKDPIAHFKSISGDGQGREILAILVDLLTTGYARNDAGTDKEMIVWPYHAEIPLKDITPGQEVELYRLVTPAALAAMREKGHYSHYRLGISHKGVWHFFQKDE